MTPHPDVALREDRTDRLVGEATAKLMSEMRIAFEFAERIEDRIREHEVELLPTPHVRCR